MNDLVTDHQGSAMENSERGLLVEDQVSHRVQPLHILWGKGFLEMDKAGVGFGFLNL